MQNWCKISRVLYLARYDSLKANRRISFLELFLFVMAGGIDTSQRKPRQLRGTPAYKFGNRLAGAVVTFGVVCGLVIK